MEIFSDLFHNFFSFVIIISVIVFIHEFGHYYVAKLCGVRVEAFSIGFGPEIYGWYDKDKTRWKISAFPLGGYVKMFGDMSEASTPDKKKMEKMSARDKKRAFHLKPLPQKAAVVAAGPAANFILAIIILTLFFMYYGRPETTAEIGSVMEGSAAAEAGFKSGDVVTELDGNDINRFEQIQRLIAINPGLPISFTLVRNGETISGTVHPQFVETEDVFGNKVRAGRLGITSGKITHVEMGPLDALVAGVTETYSISVSTLRAVGQMITGTRSADDLSGILRIGKYSGQATERGFNTVLWFMAVLSINLGLINLFPIPMLDGGHLLYYAIEGASGRPLAEKAQEYGYKVGLILLISLMVFATFNDLKYFNVF